MSAGNYVSSTACAHVPANCADLICRNSGRCLYATPEDQSEETPSHMSTDITPEGLVELAYRAENDAGYFGGRGDRYGVQIAVDTAAALRAAAAALAAREALLRRAQDILEEHPALHLGMILAAEIEAALGDRADV